MTVFEALANNESMSMTLTRFIWIRRIPGFIQLPQGSLLGHGYPARLEYGRTQALAVPARAALQQKIEQHRVVLAHRRRHRGVGRVEQSGARQEAPPKA